MRSKHFLRLFPMFEAFFAFLAARANINMHILLCVTQIFFMVLLELRDLIIDILFWMINESEVYEIYPSLDGLTGL